MSGILDGKRGIILGLANQRSIAWGIAKACVEQGAELALTYQGEALAKRVEPLAKQIGAKHLVACDVSQKRRLRAIISKNRLEASGFHNPRHRLF